MVFSSKIFLLWFLPAVLCLYHLSPRRIRNWILLAVSLLFYAYGEQIYTVVMLGSISMNYIFGRWVQARRDKELSLKLPVATSVVANLAMLGVFKYANFLIDNINVLLTEVGVATITAPQIPLPIGISFFTFQAMSYVIDVARGDAKVQNRWDHLGLYVSMFPQLIAGPIVRYRDVDKQIGDRRETRGDFVEGIRRFVIGLGKKTIIADSMARIVDSVFAAPLDELTPDLAWFVMICYAIQIYFDFSGYSDMAIGLGRMFGFRFLENFNYPYISSSITGFWRRWHMSLSSWFRDYLYIPLGGNRGGSLSTYRNLFVVFALCGLWHGASWNFVLWGLFHGSLLVGERLVHGKIPRFLRPLGHVYTLVAVLIGWVFFRAETLEQSFQIINLMFLGWGNWSHWGCLAYLDNWTVLMMIAGVLGAMPIVPAAMRWCDQLEGKPAATWQATCARILGWTALYNAFLLTIAMLCAGTYNSFIYFRF